ncbi:MAG: signal peptide peptidase SppA [Deltaproteobacteria bacterium]|nr:signal peptide peptidase SppA [Deltaproteobacteria bacterium]
MKKWSKRIGFFFLVLLALVGLKKIFSTPGAFGKALGVVEVNGAIWVSDDWVEQLDNFRKNDHIKGILVRVNSPGGTVAASQEIYSNIKRIALTKPVVVSMGTIAASGGLYLAMGANKIFADPGTITGSIGVRMDHVNLEELLRFAKIKYETIKSGKLKDMGSFTHALSPEAQTLLEQLMTEIHNQFKTVVSEARNIPKEKLDTFADGRILSGATAKELGLIDELGDFRDAVSALAKMAKIEGEPELVYADKSAAWWVRGFMGTTKIFLSGPQFCYLYP